MRPRVSAQTARTEDPAHAARRSPSRSAVVAAAGDRVLRVRRPLRRRALVRPARLPQRAHHRVVAALVLFLIGFLGDGRARLGVSIQIAYRTRPVYAKLNSQLDRYQQVIEPLRRLAMYGIPVVLGIFAGVSASSRWELALTWLNRTPFGTTDPQFGFDVGFYVFELPFYRVDRRLRLGRRAALAARSSIATNYLYGAHPGQRPRGRHLEVGAHPDRRHRPRIYLLLQARQHLVRPVRDAHREQATLITGAGYTDVNAVDPGPRRSSPASPRSSPCCSSSPRSSAAGACRSSAPRCSSCRASLIGALYPWIVAALPGRPERADARGAVHRAQHRR